MSELIEEMKSDNSFQTAQEDDSFVKGKQHKQRTGDLYYDNMQLDSSFDEQTKRRTVIDNDNRQGLKQRSQKQKMKEMYSSTGSSSPFGMGYTPGNTSKPSSFMQKASKSKDKMRKQSTGKYPEEQK